MHKDQASKTSVGVAVLRAVHQLLDPGPKILEDPVIVTLLADLHPQIWHRAADYNLPGARALRSHVLLRSRFAEDCLAHAADRGIRQCILLGAGLDTFPYRQPPWAAALHIFELDHPASQQHKRNLLAAHEIPVPDNLSFIPCDLEKESFLDALRTSSFDFSRPAFLSWLGVMPYLSPEANKAIFRQVASLLPGTELVFTFSRKDPPGQPNILAKRAAEQGEPWLTRLEPSELEQQWREAGVSRISFLDPYVARMRYFRHPATDLPAPFRSSIVKVIV